VPALIEPAVFIRRPAAIHSLAFNARSAGRGSPSRISTRPRRRLTNAAGLRNTLACSCNRPSRSNLRENRMGAARGSKSRQAPAPKRSPARERSGRPRAQAEELNRRHLGGVRGKHFRVGEIIPVREEWMTRICPCRICITSALTTACCACHKYQPPAPRPTTIAAREQRERHRRRLHRVTRLGHYFGSA